MASAARAPRARPPGRPRIPLSASDEASFQLYARLVASFRRGAISDLLQNSIRLLLAAIGPEAVEAVLDAYIAEVPPMLFPSDEALAFERFMKAQEEAHGHLAFGLAETLRFEAAVIEAIVDERTIRVALSAADGSPRIWEIGADPEPYVRELGSPERVVTAVGRSSQGRPRSPAASASEWPPATTSGPPP